MPAFGPYSPIIRTGSFYFVSGQLGINPETKKADSNIEAQTHQAMNNLRDVLGGEGLGLGHLAQATLYLARIGDFPTVNEVYESYFEPDKPKPARACVEVSGLPDVADNPLLIQIAAVAYKAQT